MSITQKIDPSTNKDTLTYTIDTFDINIKEDICTAVCYDEQGVADICAECMGLPRG